MKSNETKKKGAMVLLSFWMWCMHREKVPDLIGFEHDIIAQQNRQRPRG